MPKSLIDDLKNLAQEILQLNEDVDAGILREKTLDLFEKLTILDYQNKLKTSSENKPIDDLVTEKSEPIQVTETEIFESKVETESTNLTEKTSDPQDSPVDIEDLFIPTFDSIKEDMSQKEEFRDTITIEETEQFFEQKRIQKTQKKVTVKRIEKDSKQLSLHDKLLSNTIQIGLNDRIAFVNNLFDFSQADFNKVLSTLNDFSSRKDAFDFINYTVKPKYNWKGKEDLVERFLTIIERKYL